MLLEAPVLTHYDVSKSLVLTVDASPYGLGAVLGHDVGEKSVQPIAYKSRKLTSAERNYAQLDKEALAIAFGIQKFHKFLYGRKFTIVTDHKPLLGLLGQHKPIPNMTSPRLQRFALTLSAYDYELVHMAGEKISNADGLSRLPIDAKMEANESVPEAVIMNLDTIQCNTPVTCEKIKIWTNEDRILSKVKKLLLEGGWSEKVNDEEMKPFTKRKYELSIEAGVILWGARVIIPAKGQKKMLTELHESHPGASKMKSIARAHMWWPNMDTDIEEFVNACSVCQQQRPMPASANLHPWEFPGKAWSRLHIDYAGPFLGRMFLVIVDAHSKWVDIHSMKSATSTATINKLRQTFATHGLPDMVVSDNGSCFTSEEFKEYMKMNGIKLVHSAPFHPSSNGLAENAVKSFKAAMKKTTKGTIQENLQKYLFHQRITPHSTTGVPPAELLMNRKLKSRLDLIVPSVQNDVKKKQFKQKWYHDKSSRPREFSVGDPVLVKNYAQGNKWLNGVIAEQTGPVSFNVDVNNQMYHRHVDQLLYRCGNDDKEKIQNNDRNDLIIVDIPVNTNVDDHPCQGKPFRELSEVSADSPKPIVNVEHDGNKIVGTPVKSQPLRRSSRSTKGIPATRYEV